MECAIDRLLALRVADVMTKHVVHISAWQTMTEVARIFGTDDVSAAPVVDDVGRCIGILSATDFLKRERKCSENERPVFAMQNHALVSKEPGKPFDIEATPREIVRTHMTPEVHSVEAGISLIVAARVMADQHVHRLPVIDDSGHPVGILSTMDIVASLINAIDEWKSSLAKQD